MATLEHFYLVYFQLWQPCSKAVRVRTCRGRWIWYRVHHQGRRDLRVRVPCYPHVNTTDAEISYSCASSKHLQTRRFLDTLQSYLLDVQRILIQLHMAANERAEPFVDHAGILRDSKTGRPISGLQRAEHAAAHAYDDYSDAMSEYCRDFGQLFSD